MESSHAGWFARPSWSACSHWTVRSVPWSAEQEGLVARRQLIQIGIDWERARNEVLARRWVEHTPRVLATVTGELTPIQREWLAVLHAGPRSMLGSLTAATSHGLAGWTRPHVSVLVDDELSFEPVRGVDFFRSRRRFEAMVDPRPGIPRARIEPAVLLFAGYEAPTLARPTAWSPPRSSSDSRRRTG